MRMTKSLLLMAVLSTGLAFSSAAQAQALTPDQLTQQVKRLNAHSNKSATMLNKVDKELKSTQQQLDKVERLIDNRAMIEMLQRLDELSAEVSQLLGELEQQRHDLADLKERQRELYRDTDRRLRDLESRSTKQSTGTFIEVPSLPKVGMSSVDVAVSGKASQEVEPVEEPSTPKMSDDDSASGSIPNTTSNVTSSEEQSAYQSAFDTLKEGRYQKAKSELRSFLQNHPDSSFAGNAQYWLGEAHYVTREFKSAINEFKGVLSNYPRSLKIPDAMLKIGYTYYELMEYDLAKLLLEDLRERFPKSTAFRLAGKRLDRIRKEGH
ncbi:MAG: tol-pal system protein YbgF [Urechidicola sp.]|jgi:tol-pal system protein YbgF